MRRTLLLALTVLAALALAAPLLAAPPADAAADAAVPDLGAAVELAAPTPDWYTPALHARVLAAGPAGVPLPEVARADIPASALAFTGIRPGTWLLSPSWCTTNFVFGSPGRYAIGTAGHCTETGEEVVAVMAPGVLVSIGTTSRSVDRGVGDDFALIPIRAELQSQVNPSMAIIAGPTGTGAPAFGQAIEHVGHGVGVGTGGTPRAGAVTYIGRGDTSSDGAAYAWIGAASPGDSGSGVRAATGAAVGNLTHLVIGTEYLPSYVAGTSIARMEQIAGMRVACASLVPDPTPGGLGLGC
jgi:hypothetical protein